jgi:hypothetical protein
MYLSSVLPVENILSKSRHFYDIDPKTPVLPQKTTCEQLINKI